jgi:hypothetical protein
MLFKISLVKSKYDNKPVNQNLSYEELKSLLTTFTENTKETAPAFIAGHFKNNKRLTGELESRSLITLDLDNLKCSINNLEVLFKSDLDTYRYIAYSTASHSKNTLKIRIVLFLENEVSISDYKTISNNFINNLPITFRDAIDIKASTTPNYLMFLPMRPSPTYETWYKTNDKGEFINPGIFNYGKIETNDVNEENVDNLLITLKNKPLDLKDEQIINYLKSYDVGQLDYHEWLEVGSSLHHQYEGDIRGLFLWKKWTAKDVRKENNKKLHDIDYKWESFGKEKSNPITFATIIRKVKQLKVLTLTTLQENYNPILRNKWIDTRGEKFTPKFTEANFKILLKEYDIDIKFDVIKKETIITFNGKMERNMNCALTRIESLCELNDLKTSPANKMINLIAYENQINSWKNWVKSKPWDNKDRFKDLCDTVRVNPEYEKMKILYLKKWIIQMLHMTCLNDNEQPKRARGVLVFQGANQLGKTSWLYSLVPSSMSDYVLEGRSINTSNDMDILRCIKNVYVELGEIASTFRKSDMENLKNFITSSVDSLNIKYVAMPERYRRTTVFFATANETKFLTDTTGNSRFLVLPVIGCNITHNIDMQQLYAQLLEEAETITDYNLDEKERELQDNLNKQFESISHLEEKLEEIFEIENDNELLYKPCTATEIARMLSFDCNAYGFKNTINELAKILDKMKFKKITKPRGWSIPPRRKTQFDM